MSTSNAKGLRASAGFTLVELMVALVIGLLLTLVIAQLFVGSRRTFATTDDVSRMQENMRFATQIMTRTIHQAGFRTSPNTKSDSIFTAPNLMVAGTVGAGTAPDSITVSYQGSGVGVADGSVVNCQGTSIAPGVMSTNTFSIANVAKIDSGVTIQVPSLVCVTVTGGGAPSAPQVVVSDVDNMKILYGEDTNADGSADRFITWANLANPDAVVAVRIAMLFRSPNTATTVGVNNSQYTLNGQIAPPLQFNDTRARREMVFTVGIRNRSL